MTSDSLITIKYQPANFSETSNEYKQLLKLFDSLGFFTDILITVWRAYENFEEETEYLQNYVKKYSFFENADNMASLFIENFSGNTALEQLIFSQDLAAEWTYVPNAQTMLRQIDLRKTRHIAIQDLLHKGIVPFFAQFDLETEIALYMSANFYRQYNAEIKEWLNNLRQT